MWRRGEISLIATRLSPGGGKADIRAQTQFTVVLYGVLYNKLSDHVSSKTTMHFINTTLQTELQKYVAVAGSLHFSSEYGYSPWRLQHCGCIDCIIWNSKQVNSGVGKGVMFLVSHTRTMFLHTCYCLSKSEWAVTFDSCSEYVPFKFRSAMIQTTIMRRRVCGRWHICHTGTPAVL